MRLSDIKKVYVFEYKDMYKIGISHNTRKRLNQLKCACPTITILYESDYLKNCFYVEKNLHDMFAKYRIAGEWFSDVDISLVSKIVNSIGEKADMEKEKIVYKNSLEKNTVMKDFIAEFYMKELPKNKSTKAEIDFEKGWKFKETDKEFLVNYFKDYAKFLEEYCSGDGIEDICIVINSLEKHGVEKSKDFIQIHAKILFEAVNGKIYEYYNDRYSKDNLYIIEKSILFISEQKQFITENSDKNETL